ncbi:MAG: GNAT family N-acetyltransferase [Actinomycetota bacterium]|nr:GNAT family N-acetyltransferase [Actinomycetota bacterium]
MNPRRHAGPRVDLNLVRRLETAARRGWPAATERETPGGWVLRATPGLDRGRCNHALTPCRALAGRELAGAIASVVSFADEHGLRPGIQVSPIALHGRLESELDARGWEQQGSTLVLAGPPPAAFASLDPELVICDHADEEWLAAWGRCEPGRDVVAHAATVFAALRGRACFARVGHVAVVIGVPWAGTIGMFCLAVDPARRREGLARGLAGGLLHPPCHGELIYVQVEAGNTAALSLYQRLGLREVYRYRHRVAPASSRDQPVSAGPG